MNLKKKYAPQTPLVRSFGTHMGAYGVLYAKSRTQFLADIGDTQCLRLVGASLHLVRQNDPKIRQFLA